MPTYPPIMATITDVMIQSLYSSSQTKNIELLLIFLTFFPGYESAQENAYVKHHEKMKRQKDKAVGSAPLEPTYENNPRIKHNQEIFSINKEKKDKNTIKNKPGPTM